MFHHEPIGGHDNFQCHRDYGWRSRAARGCNCYVPCVGTQRQASGQCRELQSLGRRPLGGVTVSQVLSLAAVKVRVLPPALVTLTDAAVGFGPPTLPTKNTPVWLRVRTGWSTLKFTPGTLLPLIVTAWLVGLNAVPLFDGVTV